MTAPNRPTNPTSRIPWWSLTGFDSVSDQIAATIRAVGLTDADVFEWIYDWVPQEIDAALPAGVGLDCEYPESVTWEGRPELHTEIRETIQRIEVPRLIRTWVQRARLAGTLHINGTAVVAGGFNDDGEGGFYLAQGLPGPRPVGGFRSTPLPLLPASWERHSPPDRFIRWMDPHMPAVVPKGGVAVIEWKPAALPGMQRMDPPAAPRSVDTQEESE